MYLLRACLLVVEREEERLNNDNRTMRIDSSFLFLSTVCTRWISQRRRECNRGRVPLATDPARLEFLTPKLVTYQTLLPPTTGTLRARSPQCSGNTVTHPPPRKFRTQSSAGKVMAAVFWDSKGLLLIDYLPRRSTITGAYYSELMVKLREAIKTKRRGMLTRGVLLLHDNAPVHKSRVA